MVALLEKEEEKRRKGEKEEFFLVNNLERLNSSFKILKKKLSPLLLFSSSPLLDYRFRWMKSVISVIMCFCCMVPGWMPWRWVG